MVGTNRLPSWRLRECLSLSLMSRSALMGTKEDAPPPERRALLPASLLLNWPDHIRTAFMYLIFFEIQFSRSVASDSLQPTDCSTPGLPVHHQLPDLLKLKSIESVMPSNHLIFCCPLLLQASVFPNIGVFSNEGVLHIRWPKYWSFNLSISPSNEYSGLISFRIDWFDFFFFFFEILFTFGCAGSFSSCGHGPLPLWSVGSRARGLRRCGTWALWLLGTWHPPGAGMEPAGEHSNTGPPGKSTYLL